MKPETFTFIEKQAFTVEPCVPPICFPELLKRWDHYHTEKNADIMNYIWKYISPFIPTTCNSQKLVGYDLDRVSLIKNYSKEMKREKKKIDKKRNVSLMTVLIYCEKDGAIRFHDDKEKNIKFVNPNATHYQVNMLPGNAVFFTNKVKYQVSNNYVLKIPIFYKKKVKFDLSKNQYIKIDKKTFEIPTPNAEKYNKVQYLDNGNIVTLSSDLKDINVIKRWNQVENRGRILNIQKYQVPSYIDKKRGRPPTDDEDYCPNCFEILSLKPVNYTNCSGCLSPIQT